MSMNDSIQRQMDNLERALERGDISQEEYDLQMDELLRWANGEV